MVCEERQQNTMRPTAVRISGRYFTTLKLICGINVAVISQSDSSTNLALKKPIRIYLKACAGDQLSVSQKCAPYCDKKVMVLTHVLLISLNEFCFNFDLLC
jgi:hypothetical protein